MSIGRGVSKKRRGEMGAFAEGPCAPASSLVYIPGRITPVVCSLVPVLEVMLHEQPHHPVCLY